MNSFVPIVYHYLESQRQRLIDTDRYGYIDMVFEIYNNVLRHVEEGRTVKFQINCVLPDGVEQMHISTDNDVREMLNMHVDSDIIKIVVSELDVSDHKSREFTVNGFPSSVVGRDGKFDREDNIIGTLESVVASPRRPAKTTVRRGKSHAGLHLYSREKNIKYFDTPNSCEGIGTARGRSFRGGISGRGGMSGGRGSSGGLGIVDAKIYSKSVVRFEVNRSKSVPGPTKLSSHSGIINYSKGKNVSSSTSSATMSGDGEVKVDSNSNATPFFPDISLQDRMNTSDLDSDRDCYDPKSASEDADWHASSDESDDESDEDIEVEGVSEQVEDMGNVHGESNEGEGNCTWECVGDYKSTDLCEPEFYTGEETHLKLEKGMLFGSVTNFREALRECPTKFFFS